jgi:hypothetical protein
MYLMACRPCLRVLVSLISPRASPLLGNAHGMRLSQLSRLKNDEWLSLQWQ